MRINFYEFLKSAFILLFVCILLTASGGVIYGQERVITGEVLSEEENEPMIGVNVMVPGTTLGTITNVDGTFSLQVSDGVDRLAFSFVGYQTDTISIANRSHITVILSADVMQLADLVVIGYGQQRERDLTSAITTVNSEEITKTPTGAAMQTLQGKVPGLQVVSSGEPGSSPTVRLRGVGTFQGNIEPLYVVDGMFFDNIDFLNTADIESISVLKDASAKAIFGVRAANGVVIIQTQSGNYNQPASIEYDGYYGVQVAQNVLKMANAEQFTRYVTQTGSPADASFIDNAFQRYGRSRINPNVPDVNTDWYDEVLKPYAPIQNHSLNISGGGKKSSYSVGASYFNQQGILEHTRNQYERINFRTKLDLQATEWLTVGGNINLSNATQFNADGGVWFRTYFAVPIIPVYDSQNTAAYPEKFSNAQQLGYRGTQNPFYNLFYDDNRNKIGKILGNFYMEFDLIPNILSFKTTYNYNYGAINERNVDFEYNDGVNQVVSAIRKSNQTTYNQIWDNVLTFNESFGRHYLTVMGGYSFRSESNEGLYVRGTELDPAPSRDHEELWYLHYAGLIDEDGSGDSGSTYALGEYGASWFGRIAYNFDDRYLLYGTFRQDGSNKFQKKWARFPTVGAGWVLSEENFFNVGFINFLKFRGSWGRLGNDAVPFAVGAPTLEPISTAINGQLISGSEVISSYDFLDQWETSEEINAGISSVFFNNRLSLEADYYVRETQNAVVTIILPLIRDNIRRNSGQIRNSGFEVSLDWSDRISDNFSFNLGGNLATLKNEVISLGGQQYLDAGTAEFRQRSIVGKPMQAFFGYEVLGVFQNNEQVQNSGLTDEFIASNNLIPGDFIYKDQNNDGVIDDLDRVVLGSYLPKLTYGFNLGLSYRNFDLSAYFQGQSGYSILNRKRGEIIFTTDTNIDAELATNLWRGENSSNKYPSAAGLRKGYNQAMSDYYVEDGSYFRIQNVRLSYNLLNNELFGTRMPDVRITFTAERPVTLFNYNGFNPEVANGVDRQTYPIPAVYTVGLNLNL